jgi:hypothetical protein
MSRGFALSANGETGTMTAAAGEVPAADVAVGVVDGLAEPRPFVGLDLGVAVDAAGGVVVMPIVTEVRRVSP